MVLFVFSTMDRQGGAFYIEAGSVNVSNSVITGNSANADAGGARGDDAAGGAFYISGGGVNVSNSVVTGNSAVSILTSIRKT